MNSNEFNSIGFSKSDLTLNSELRHLPIKDRIQLASLLDVNHNWKLLAGCIPKPDGGVGQLINASDMNTLEDLIKRGISPTQALLDYWGTCGRQRATIEDLIKLLNSCNLFRASLYLCKDLLQMESFGDNYDLKCDNQFSDQSINKLMNDLNLNINNESNNRHFDKYSNKLNDFPTNLVENSCDQSSDNDNNNGFVDPSAPNESLISFSSDESNERQFLDNEDITHYSYDGIRCATNDFSEISVADGGHKLGEGAFGTVFRCRLNSSSDYIAVKKLKNDFQKQFVSELKVLSKFRHQNLLSLCGISSDGPSLLIVYDYMSNGSLQDYLEHKKESLLWPQRLNIGLGTAKGICHLHTFDEKPFVHRDIKSANILLDDNLNPKVGDFGLVRVGSSGDKSSTNPLATTIFGTSVYMAPEAFRGDISVKLDSFSFGIVLWELLSGLKPYDEDRDGIDLLSYIEDKTNDFEDGMLDNIIDKSIGNFSENITVPLYQMARNCTEQRKKDRPTMTEVLESLEKIEFTLES